MGTKTIKANVVEGYHLKLGAILVCTLLIFQQARAQTVFTLAESISVAKSNSPDIRKSNLNLYSNQKSLDAQRKSLRSRVDLNVTPFEYYRSRVFEPIISQWNTYEEFTSFANLSISQPIAATDGTISLNNRFGYQDSFSSFADQTINTYSNYLYLQYDQPIFTYNRIKLTVKELELNLENATISNALQLLQLEQSVTQSFYALYQRQNDLEIAEDEYENQLISHEVTKTKVEADLLAKEELFQSELNLSTSKSTMENARVILDNTADDFKFLVGIGLEEEIEVEVDVQFITQEVNLEQAIQYGLNNRMELRQRNIEIERSLFELTRTKALNEFKGSVGFSLGVFGDNPTASRVYQSPETTPRFSVNFTIPIWDWGENKARMEASKANLEINEVDLEVQRNEIVMSIRKAYRNLQNLETQITIAEQNVKNAQITYEINLERYRNGDLTSFDLGRFQNQLSSAKTDRATALINYKIELLNLKILSLYDFEKKERVITPFN